MPEDRNDLSAISLGSAKQIGLRLVAEGRFEDLSEACRAGLRRLGDDAHIVNRLVQLGNEGMSSGIDEAFDIDAFVRDTAARA